MQYDVGGEQEFVAGVIARTVHEQQDQVPAIALGHGVEKYPEAFGVGRRQDQKDASPVLGRHRPIQIDILADQSGGDRGPRAERAPSTAVAGSCGQSAPRRRT